MSYVNLTLIGRVGSQPEQRYTPSGKAVTSFSLAVNEYHTGADGQRNETAFWYRITCWERLAETVNQYVNKGQQVAVYSSRIESRAYIDKEGNAKATTEITARRVVFLGSRDAVGTDSTARGEALAADKNGGAGDEDSIPF